MNIWQYVLVAVVGVASGILSGLFGVGGGVLIIPSLVVILGFSQHDAQGTSLVALLLPVGLLGVIRYWKAGHVDWIAGLIIAAGLFAGAYFGAGWANKISEVWLKRAFGVLLILVGIRFILSKATAVTSQ